MKEVRRVKFTGKNLNDVFALPCVKKIIKIVNKPQLVINPFLMVGNPLMDVARIGDELVEYDNGQWEIVRDSCTTDTRNYTADTGAATANTALY